MWTCPVSGDCLHNNIGVATGGGLVVLDIDVKNSRRGMASLWGLISQGFPLRGRYVVRTPTGGLHIYLPDSGVYIPNGTNRLPGIDVRGHHGYVVGAGSVIGDRAYEEV